ncbi:MAG: hypothetical protein IIW78_01975 [Clostridia bacterium]|nr:hypothetical protein [Clostridia bacterium]MBQ5612712.1 hypothetical protein [Clostridia bacterium]MBQ5661535.1 hypothetical protein [Clostridia bacterium]MBQ5892999.1 hypothetical protein [Clostridia bacterium]
MEQATVTRATEEILQGVYKNIKMAEDAILDLMPRVKDEALKSDLTVQLAAYEAFASRTAKLLEREGVKPVSEGALTRLSAKWGTMMNAMKDSSSTHLAEMVVEGATMGVNDLLSLLRDGRAKSVDEDVLRLAQDLCAYEERTVNEMRAYLR